MKTKKSGLVQKFNVYDVIIYIVLIGFACAALYPFIYTLAGSLNDAQDLQYGPVWFLPRQFTLASYMVELKDQRLYTSFANTFIATVVTLVCALLLTSCVAYALASNRLKGRKFFWYANLITMFIHGGMIPTYMLIVLTGLYDNFLVYILPAVYSVYNMIILQNFFRSIDTSLYEAAVLDGASEFRIWLTIYLPISKPALATVGLWIVVGRWNSYMPTMLYTSKKRKYVALAVLSDALDPRRRNADDRKPVFWRGERADTIVCGDRHFVLAHTCGVSFHQPFLLERDHDRLAQGLNVLKKLKK